MSQPQDLPELLQAKLKLSLLNWGKRTLIWSAVLGLLSTQMPPVKVLLIAWIVFSLFSLAALLLGLKLARHLKAGSFSAFPGHPGSGPGPRQAGDNFPHSPGGHLPGTGIPGFDTRREEREEDLRPAPPAEGEIIDIEAEVEVLPPEEKRNG